MWSNDQIRVCLVVLCSLLASPLYAQTVNADRYRLSTGPCMLRSGSGTPEGVVVGNVCDLFISTTTGVWYTKWTGSGNTGWGVGHNANARVNGDLDVTGYVGVPGYVSQLTGYRITAAGSGDFRYLYADELRIKLFSVEEQAVYRASLMVTPSHSEVSQSFTCPAASGTATLWVRDAATLGDARIFASGHWVVLRNFVRTDADSDGNQELAVGDCVGQVTSYTDGSGANAGQQSWTFTRGAGGSAGTMTASTVVSVGAGALDFGVSGNGAVELNAYDGAEGINAPYIQTKRWTTAPVAANFSLTSRLGKLTGITGTADEFGLIAGTYAATNGQYLRASNAAFELHGIDLSLWQGATKTFFVDHAVPSLALGAAVPSAYGTGTGIWMGNDSGTYKFRVGTPGGAGMFWDGTSLVVRGTAGSSTNQILNSDCKLGTTGWTNATDSGGAMTFSTNYLGASTYTSDYPLLNGGTCWLNIAGTPAGGTISYIFSGKMPVVAGNRYEFSVYTGLYLSTSAEARIAFFDAAGATISVSAGTPVGTNDIVNDGITGFNRPFVLATAPANAKTAQVYAVALHSGSGTSPYLFIARAFFGEATPTQTEPSPWGPAGVTQITGGMIQTETILASHIAANAITAAKIAAGTITATEIAATTITAAKIAAGTITGTQIAAGTISAGHIGVSSLSALSANIGSVTAGTITGVSIVGATVTGTTSISGATITGGSVTVGNGAFAVDSIGNMYADTASIGLGLQLGFLGGSGNRHVCVDNGGNLYMATAGGAGTC